jgi:uncharacterized oxidoreductase
MQISGNKILITGGGSGIGLGLTERFIKEGNSVIICGRRESVLKEVSKKFPDVIIKNCDLSNEEERIDLYNWIIENHSDTNVLINNAGIQNWMNIDDGTFYKYSQEEITTNIIAPVHLAILFSRLKSVKTIMNVTSGLAFIPLAKVPIYSATKAFMRSFTLSLRHQLKESKIEVIEIIPPALNTDLGGKGIHDAYPSVSDFIESIFKQLKNGCVELTFGMSEERLKENNETIIKGFNFMNF